VQECRGEGKLTRKGKRERRGRKKGGKGMRQVIWKDWANEWGERKGDTKEGRKRVKKERKGGVKKMDNENQGYI
jgi:hypothetical protein